MCSGCNLGLVTQTRLCSTQSSPGCGVVVVSPTWSNSYIGFPRGRARRMAEPPASPGSERGLDLVDVEGLVVVRQRIAIGVGLDLVVVEVVGAGNELVGGHIGRLEHFRHLPDLGDGVEIVLPALLDVEAPR